MIGIDTLYASVSDLAAAIRKRSLSPVDLTEACLERLNRLGAGLGAVVTITRDTAIAQARAAEAEIARGNYRGPLHGIPFGAKDLLATQGIPTTWGAAPYKDQVFDYDATVIERLREAGAVLAAKLSMVELAGGFGYNNADASFTGPGRTPWNKDYWSGGSSSGPGAAVSAGMVGFAIGSETSGSILTPSAFCGITGLRPTYGRVSRHGAMALCWTLDKLGPMCRTARDCALVLSAISGKDPRDLTSVGARFHWQEAAATAWKRKRPKVGVVKGSLDHVQPEVKRNFEAGIKVLADFCEIGEDVAFPDLPFGQVVGTIVDAEGASAFLELIESGRAQELRVPRDRIGGYSASMVSAVDYLQAMRLRGPMKRELGGLLAKFDALAAPTRATVAYPIGVDFEKAYPGVGGGPALIPAGNAIGAPAICFPNGFGERGLPTSMQLLGAPFREGMLVDIAHAFQKRTDWHSRRPLV